LIDSGSAVLVFGDAAQPEAVRAAMRAGACGFVPSSADVGRLAAAVRAAASGAGWVSPQLAFMLLDDDAPDRPPLSADEREALRLYAGGMPKKSVARRMNVNVETARRYLERVLIKYRRAARDAARDAVGWSMRRTPGMGSRPPSR
jgi:DNA-binding NarL/FixJ family response regulator